MTRKQGTVSYIIVVAIMVMIAGALTYQMAISMMDYVEHKTLYQQITDKWYEGYHGDRAR